MILVKIFRFLKISFKILKEMIISIIAISLRILKEIFKNLKNVTKILKNEPKTKSYRLDSTLNCLNQVPEWSG